MPQTTRKLTPCSVSVLSNGVGFGVATPKELRMAKLRANGLNIEYDTFGASNADPLLLIMGLGTQMVAWPPEFCNALAEAGHFVVRFDNRDVGLSTKFDGITRVKTLTSIMSSSGDPDLPGARREVRQQLFSRRPKSNDMAIVADGSRVERLSTIDAPTLVIHGKEGSSSSGEVE